MQEIEPNPYASPKSEPPAMASSRTGAVACWAVVVGSALGCCLGAVVAPIVIIAVVLLIGMALGLDLDPPPGDEPIGWFTLPCMALVLGPLGALVGALMAGRRTESHDESGSAVLEDRPREGA